MKRIYLVGTSHTPVGEAGVDQLLAILLELSPEVIFVEAPAAWDQETYLSHVPQSLEAMAVREYLSCNAVAVVPVDAPTPDEAFFRSMKHLFNELGHKSYDFFVCDRERNARIASEGFKYLNSEAYAQHYLAKHDVTVKAIQKLRAQWADDAYKEWCATDDLRETAMIANISDYCTRNDFRRAVLLVGADHRQSIIEKSRQMQTMNRTDIEWSYSIET